MVNLKELAKIFIGKVQATKTIRIKNTPYQLTITFGELQIHPIDNTLLKRAKKLNCDCIIKIANSGLSIFPKVGNILCSTDPECQKKLLEWFKQNFPKIVRSLFEFES